MITKYFLWFIIYSVSGWLYETAVCSVQHKKFVNRGFLNGPYCPIYGSGVLLVITLFGRMKNPLLLFVLSAIATCALEYLTSYCMEKLFHAKWWDYSEMPFNLHGRICLLGALVFGAFSVLIVLCIQPRIEYLTSLIPVPAQYVISALFAAAMLADLCSTLRTMSDFQKKLDSAAHLISEKRAEMSEKLHESTAHESVQKHLEELAQRITRRQKRILTAFPGLKLHRHDELLKDLRNMLDGLKKNKKCQ